MAKIYLFGNTNLNIIPHEMEQGIAKLAAEGHEFIIGDAKGTDSSLHIILSRLGVISNVTIYGMDRTRNNRYKAKERIFNVSFDDEAKTASIFDKNTEEVLLTMDNVAEAEDISGDRRYYEFKDKLMVDECAIAMCLWDGESKREFHIIQLLGMRNKPCYVYKPC